jgi:hypothetical protein
MDLELPHGNIWRDGMVIEFVELEGPYENPSTPPDEG